MKKTFIILFLFAVFSTFPVSFVSAKTLYGSDFEKENIGSTPQGWEQIVKGNGTAKVVKDPLNSNNKAFASSDVAAGQARHDVGGSIFGVGDVKWQDYMVEFDGYFPEEYYMGLLFRLQGNDAFYLFDRRSGGELGTFDFWRRQGAAWSNIKKGAFVAEPKKWFRFRISVKGDTFEAYGKPRDDKTTFKQLKPIITGTDSTYKNGKVALYGLIYVDNFIIGEAEEDLVLAVELRGKIPIIWGQLKR